MILKRLLLFLFLSSVSVSTLSQNNITGIWEGVFLVADTDLGQPKLVVEIHDFKDSIFTGITHLYYKGNKYEHYKMIGRYLKKDSLLLFIESSTIGVDLGIYSNCLGKYMMQLKRQGNDMFQEGFWEPNIKGCSSTSAVFLYKRVEEKKVAPEPVKKPVPAKKLPMVQKPAVVKSSDRKPSPAISVIPVTPATKNNPATKVTPSVMPGIIAQRETDVQSLLEIAAADKDSIKVEVYDNGDIDGDSVSVYEEQLLRINKKLITAKPITFYISLNKNVNPIAHLRLVAESLGSIPPCTALMIVTTKSKRYEVRLSSNFNKNATVELFLKE